MKKRNLAALVLSLLVAGSASASPGVIKLANGKGGPYQKLGEEKGKDYAGPGTEQSVAAFRAHPADKTVDVMTVWMSSDVSESDRPWQGKCSVLRLSATGQPKLVVDQKQITKLGDPNNADERPFNHPHLTPVLGAKGKTEYFLLSYGSDDDNGNVQTYGALLDSECNVVSKLTRISQNNNNNQGAPWHADMGNGRFLIGYYDGNDQRTYVRPGRVDDTDPKAPKLELTDNSLTVVTPSNIGRPAIEPMANNRALVCAAKGNNRPPEDGVQCAYVGISPEGKASILWKQYIDESQPGQGIYYNQPTIAGFGEGTAAILTLRSNGNGKKTNDKGKTTTMLSFVSVDDEGMQIKAKRESVGLNEAHTGLCSGGFGTEGQRYAVAYNAPITGAGQPGAQLVGYDPVTKNVSVDRQRDYFTVGYAGDSGYLANIYGQNPNDQGRDYLRCIGDVPNPGFEVQGGWQSDVKSFFVFPHSGRIQWSEAEPKNALYLTLLPGATKAPQIPEPPKDLTEVSDETGSEGEPSSSGSGLEDGGTTGGGPLLSSPQASSGCSVGRGRDDSRSALAALLLVSVGVGFAHRRAARRTA
ncbi:MAG: hypothetical protein FJ096_09800 [Deltaproteobacteria bacterium]|nr:hypothetical protein [Deltaproteobacteria bacterium]